MRMLNKGQFDFWLRRDERKTLGSAFINRLFNIEVVLS
ncbi:mobile element protein [Vibrio astriarenae]|nr:mobile element protein [Vibrio sp. C7]